MYEVNKQHSCQNKGHKAKWHKNTTRQQAQYMAQSYISPDKWQYKEISVKLCIPLPIPHYMVYFDLNVWTSCLKEFYLGKKTKNIMHKHRE